MKFWDEVGLGTRITELVKKPDYRQVFMYSAITWNRHLIHYNSAQAMQEGHKDVVVQRALLGSYLAQMISDWINEEGVLRRLEWKVVQSAFPGDILVCKGEVFKKDFTEDEKKIYCNVYIENQKKVLIVKGSALIDAEPNATGGSDS